MTFKARAFAAASTCVAAFLCGAAAAGEFSVNPIRIELGASARSGVITIKNEGQEKLSFQLDAKEWTQDDAGNDQYGETRDLIFFPKIMTIEPGQEGLIRVGAKNPVVPSEKTYRVFIEQLPGAAKRPETSAAQVNVLIRFGEPVFVAPLKPRDGLEIEGLALAQGALTFLVRNSGNRHQIVQGIRVRGTDRDGNETYALTLADRYLLAGTVKPYSASIAADKCSRTTGLEVEIKTDKASAKRNLDVTRAMCP